VHETLPSPQIHCVTSYFKFSPLYQP
jgi:hypothetical protein